MAQTTDYNPPEVGTVFLLRSKYAEDPRLDIVKKIGSILESKGMIRGDMKPTGYIEPLRIRLSEYVKKFPLRKHKGHWIDGGKQVAVFHPDTFIPFFLNDSGSRIARLCNGKHPIREMIARSKKESPSVPEETLVNNLMKFLLLLEELDLIEFVG
jgi:hypothetical protein